MAQQELFKSKAQIKKERTEKLLREKAIVLWRVHATEYRELPDKYRELLEQKKQHRYIYMGRLKKEVLQEYPVIPFLEVLSEQEARQMLDQWQHKGRLAKEVELLEEILLTDNSINSLRAWCRDFTYKIAREEYDRDKAKRLRGNT